MNPSAFFGTINAIKMLCLSTSYASGDENIVELSDPLSWSTSFTLIEISYGSEANFGG